MTTSRASDAGRSTIRRGRCATRHPRWRRNRSGSRESCASPATTASSSWERCVRRARRAR